MPQMAPSLWLLIYLFMVMMIIMLMSNLFFHGRCYNQVDQPLKINKFMKFQWQ
uniref:ATP synthase F0 subunit 8 n=1 Tax=Longipodacrangonyx sp. 1 MDMBR-2012 TaxID=1200665 RepID=K7ZVN2_9CRUS|nr:ATP synthase F0 subunit 8 [Longipodacrangonyx sp. 1 MDMBR-2012]